MPDVQLTIARVRDDGSWVVEMPNGAVSMPAPVQSPRIVFAAIVGNEQRGHRLMPIVAGASGWVEVVGGPSDPYAFTGSVYSIRFDTGQVETIGTEQSGEKYRVMPNIAAHGTNLVVNPAPTGSFGVYHQTSTKTIVVLFEETIGTCDP